MVGRQHGSGVGGGWCGVDLEPGMDLSPALRNLGFLARARACLEVCSAAIWRRVETSGALGSSARPRLAGGQGRSRHPEAAAADPQQRRRPPVPERADRVLPRHAQRMRYDEYLRLGYGIGSGAVESAHKQVVHARMRQAGMRWSEAGARRLLALRLQLLNDRWDMLDQLRHDIGGRLSGGRRPGGQRQPRIQIDEPGLIGHAVRALAPRLAMRFARSPVVIPADLRSRLEAARLDLLALFRALDRMDLAPRRDSAGASATTVRIGCRLCRSFVGSRSNSRPVQAAGDAARYFGRLGTDAPAADEVSPPASATGSIHFTLPALERSVRQSLNPGDAYNGPYPKSPKRLSTPSWRECRTQKQNCL